MGLFNWLLNIGDVFTATCPKCQKTVTWGNCPNCGNSRFMLGQQGLISSLVSRPHFTCTVCGIKYRSFTCTCGCEIDASFFGRTSAATQEAANRFEHNPFLPQSQSIPSVSLGTEFRVIQPPQPEPRCSSEAPCVEQSAQDNGPSDEVVAEQTHYTPPNPPTAAQLCERGWASYRLNEMQQALEHFDHAIRLDPRLAEAYRGRAAARGWDDADKTIADYEEALRLNPDDEALKGSLIEMYVNHASFFLENGECGKAVELYSKAMSLDPPDGGFGYEVFVWRGDAFFKQGEVAKAAADYSVALQMGEHEKDDNPETYSDILSKRASCYLKLEQYAKAKRDMEESQKLDPEFSEDETADQREPDGPRCRQCGEEIDADEEVTHLDCCRGPYHEECLRSFMCRSCGQCRRCCDRTACGREPFAEPECHKCGEPITRDEDISKCYYCRRPVHEKCVEWCPACHKCLDCCRSKGCALKAEG